MLNKVILMGRLTRDPELRYTSNSSTAVARYSIAIQRSFSKQGAEREVDFINIVAWGKAAEFVSQYFKKGKMIVVIGRLQTSKWTDKDGQSRSTMEVIAEEQQFGESKNAGPSGTDLGQDIPFNPMVGSSSNNGGFDSSSDDSDFSLADVDEKDLPF